MANIIAPPGDKGAQVADGDADEHAAPGHHAEARDAEAHLRAADIVKAELAEGLEHVVEHHSHAVVQQRLAEHHNVQHLVNLDLVKPENSDT